MRVHKQKPSRGRGNQGDWYNNRSACGTLPEHKDHNAAIDAAKKLKKEKKKK